MWQRRETGQYDELSNTDKKLWDRNESLGEKTEKTAQLLFSLQ